MTESRMNPKGALIAAVTILALAGCGKEQAAGGGAGFQMPPTPVETALVSQAGVIDRFEAVGSVEASEAITVVSEIPGIVVSLPFTEGEQVNAGALLAKLDDVELRAALDRAEAILAQRQAAFNRVEHVADQGAGTPQDLDDAAAALKVAQADADLGRARLAKCRITAPFAGRVGSRQVSPGAFIQPGATLTHLSRIDVIEVVFSAPERYVPKLARGAQVSISSNVYPGESLSGSIEVVEPALDPETRSVQVIARAANPGGRFRPGMSADVSAVLSRRDEALTIPAEAVFIQGNQPLVYVINPDSTVAPTPVTLGTRLTASVEVLSGLEVGQQVVRAGHQKLYPGAHVMPIMSREAPGEPSDAGAAAPAGPGSDSEAGKKDAGEESRS